MKLEKDRGYVTGGGIAVNFNFDTVVQISAQLEPHHCEMQLRGRRAPWPAYRIEGGVNRRG